MVTEKLNPATIDFNPTRQVLHGPTEFRVRIRDPLGIPPEHKVVVMHNGYDVSAAFKGQSEKLLLPDQQEIEIAFPMLRIPASEEHEIDVYYFRESSSAAPVARAEYLAPTCSPFQRDSVANTGSFFVPKKMLYMINRVASKGDYNPSFVTALIAQESGFRNSAVSWAKAMGMTQVTPPAEQMIISKFPNFPQYPGLNEMTVPHIKALIAAGIVNGNNEWRLDDEMGVKGGVAYLNYVRQYWSSPENKDLIQSVFRNKELGLARVILASYNSGPYRVKRALHRSGARWLDAEDLSEAKRYVRRIFSYCYHFSQPELDEYPLTEPNSISGPEPAAADHRAKEASHANAS